jgi:hypothetical protein
MRQAAYADPVWLESQLLIENACRLANGALGCSAKSANVRFSGAVRAVAVENDGTNTAQS